MRHINYTLTPKAIDAAKPRDKPHSLTDGGGLLVEVLPGGSKVWRYKYHLDGRREKVTLGQYPALSIKAARDEHERLRAMVAAGESPARSKRVDAATGSASPAAHTVRSFSMVWIDETMHARAPTYRAQQIRWLDQFVCPGIGGLELTEVLPLHVLQIVEALRDRPVTAEGVRTMVQRMFNYAARKLLVTSNPATPMRGLVVRPPAQHHVHLPQSSIGSFWRRLSVQGAQPSTLMCAQILALTMLRKSEARLARWGEIDLIRAVWDIPADRMKMRRPHRVYLSRQAVDLLRAIRPYSGRIDPETGATSPSAYVFPSISRHGAIADVTINHLFARMDIGVPGFSPHGLRGTAATLLREHGWRRDVVELLLAHAERDSTVAAYSHHELADERRAALQWWADAIDTLAAAEGECSLIGAVIR